MNSGNRYHPTSAHLADPIDATEADLATRFQRLGAALLDLMVAVVYSVPLMMGLGMWEYLKEGKPVPLSLTVTSAVVGFMFFLLAHGYLLKKNGQTIGKKIVGIRIADLDGNVPDFGKVIGLRYLPISIVTVIPVLGQLLPVIDVLFIFRPNRRCLHDLIAGTKVLRVH